MLALVWHSSEGGPDRAGRRAGGGNLARLALRNAARNPGRSTLTIGLVAAASFLIVAVSAFRLDPSGQTPALHSGNGGFALAAESDQPIFQQPELARRHDRTWAFRPRTRRLLAGSTIVSLRVRAGDDASCLNLYRPRQPRVLGVPPALIDRDGFAWADKPRDVANPWRLLDDQARRRRRRRAGHPGKEHGQLLAEPVGRTGRNVRDRRRPRPAACGCRSWPCWPTASSRAICWSSEAGAS